jgi:Flp pilus assembly protein TadG
VLLFVLCGLASLAIDLGRVYLAKGELAGAADAAARAACAALPNGVSAAKKAAADAAADNKVAGQSVRLDAEKDVIFGTWDPSTRQFTVLSGAARDNANAVRVSLARTAADGNALPLMFAQAFGQSTCDVHSGATACLTGRASAYSIIGLNFITASGGLTDSYNSSLGAYGPGRIGHLGSIASNGAITLSNNANIDGDVRCGVGKTATLTTGAKATGLIAPLGTTLKFASVTLPTTGVTEAGDCIMSSGTTTVPGGTYVFDTIDLSGTAHITWQGAVKFYVRTAYRVSGSVVIDTYNNIPANRVIYFLPTCKTATWTGSHSCIGELYAPDTDFTIGGSAQLFGRITAKSITLSSTGGMHYDEALPPLGKTTTARQVTQVQ